MNPKYSNYLSLILLGLIIILLAGCQSAPKKPYSSPAQTPVDPSTTAYKKNDIICFTVSMSLRIMAYSNNYHRANKIPFEPSSFYRSMKVDSVRFLNTIVKNSIRELETKRFVGPNEFGYKYYSQCFQYLNGSTPPALRGKRCFYLSSIQAHAELLKTTGLSEAKAKSKIKRIMLKPGSSQQLRQLADLLIQQVYASRSTTALTFKQYQQLQACRGETYSI